jgi:tetratricopeptide (TPR) repeat protein
MQQPSWRNAWITKLSGKWLLSAGRTGSTLPRMVAICRVRLLILATVLALGASVLRAQELSELSLPPNGMNQKAEVSQWIGPVRVTITYHSPNVHGGGGADRTGHIWGELLKYGLVDEGFGPTKAAPWRAGANESTTISFSHDVRIAGRSVKAGTYALFLELEATAPWSWILSNQIGWGSYQYDPANDVLHVPATPADAPYTEFLTFGFDDRRPDSAVAFLQWEKKRIDFKIEVPDVNELYVAEMRKQLLAWPGFNYESWRIAAQFCADHKINLEEALTWADKAISNPFRGAAQGREDFYTLRTKAAVLHAMGRDSDADAVMDRAINLAGTPSLPIHQYGVSLIAAGRKEKAMQVFQTNRRLHPDDAFVTYVGLARGYTALGDKKNAIANWEIALRNVPDNQKANLPVYEQALKALKEAR